MTSSSSQPTNPAAKEESWPLLEKDLATTLISAGFVEDFDEAKALLFRAFWKYAFYDEEQIDAHDQAWVVDQKAMRIAEVSMGDRTREELSSQEQGRFDAIKQSVQVQLFRHYGIDKTR